MARQTSSNQTIFATGSCYGSLLLLLALATPGAANQPHIVDVDVNCDPQRRCTFQVSVQHHDQGWDHYANRWEILGPDDAIIAVRTLHHPHDHEQPFTRSLRDVDIPQPLTSVRLRAHDSVHGYGPVSNAVLLFPDSTDTD
ncbi:MAG: hypothetical protein Tsb002_14730 [Wenzhouxiangellaceae bacterium]